MTVQEYIDNGITAAITITSFRNYEGLANTKNEMPTETSTLIFEGGSIVSDEAINTDSIEVIDDSAQDVYMAQAKAAVQHACNDKFGEANVDVEIDGLNIVLTVKNLTKTTVTEFGTEVFTTVINCDPTQADKASLKDGHYSKKSMIYMIALQLNAAIKMTKPAETAKGFKAITIRASKAKPKKAKAETTEAEDLKL